MTKDETLEGLVPGAVTLDIEGLSPLLKRAPSTLRVDMCRKPESIPPAIYIPGTTKPLWLVTDVIEWLKRYQAKPGAKRPQPPQFQKARGLQSPGKKGASSKAERVEAARQKVSVAEARRRAANKPNQSAPAAA